MPLSFWMFALGSPLPWRPVHPMAAAPLTGFPEEHVADVAQVGEPNPFRIGAKSLEDFVGGIDEIMILIMILFVKGLTCSTSGEHSQSHRTGRESTGIAVDGQGQAADRSELPEGSRSSGGYIASGAVMPMRLRQRARTLLVASASLRRALVISASSGSDDTTRHCW